MNREKVVISGINGFVGHHLAKELDMAGAYVIGIGQENKVSNELVNIVRDYYQADLTEAWPNITGVKAIIHLAGLAAIGPSFDKPQKYIDANSSMVTNLCEFYLKQDTKPRVVLVCSGAIYSSSQKLPINESGIISLSSPYVISKVLNESQAAYYRSRGLDCVVIRPFNHIGPGQAEGFVLPDFYYRLATLGKDERTIITGNIETKRDYTDVRDIARAYRMIALADNLKYHIYNVCSGVSISGREIFNQLKHAMGLDDVTFKIDKSLVRPTDVDKIVGDSSRLKDELGWEPQINIQQTVVDFVKSKSK